MRYDELTRRIDTNGPTVMRLREQGLLSSGLIGGSGTRVNYTERDREVLEVFHFFKPVGHNTNIRRQVWLDDLLRLVHAVGLEGLGDDDLLIHSVDKEGLGDAHFQVHSNGCLKTYIKPSELRRGCDAKYRGGSGDA